MLELSKVFILAGGKGTRLHPLTLTRHKSMIPLGSKPVIEHLITQISQSGFTEFIITVGHQKEQVMHHINDGSGFGITVDYSIEPEGIMLGTAGGVKLASHLLTDTFMVLQGDAYMTFNLAKVVNVHRRTKADATIILREVSDPWLFGVVVCDSDMRIAAFQEKPLQGQEQSNLVSTGIYCLELDVIDLIQSGESDFAHDVFPQLLKEKKRLFGFVSKGAWMDIGSRKGYLEGTRLVLENSNLPDNIMIKKNSTIDATTRIIGPTLIESGVSIGQSSQIGPNVVLKAGVTVAKKTVIQNTTVLEDTLLGDRVRIQDSIIGEKASLANDVTVYGSIIGPGSELEKFVRIENGSRIWPGIIVHANTRVQGRLILPTDQPFYFYSDVGKYTGITATTVLELATRIQEVDVKSVEFHLYRRDFERWIREVYHAFELVEKIVSLRKEAVIGEKLKSKLITTIKDWYTDFIETNR